MIVNKKIAILTQEDMAIVIEGFIKEYNILTVTELMDEMEQKTDLGLRIEVDKERYIFVEFSEVYQFLSNENLNRFDGNLKAMLSKLKEENDESGFLLQCTLNKTA